MNTTGSRKRFRVALSFPRGQRNYVEKVAKALAERFAEARVLYDRFHTAEFAEADLAFNLPDLYRKESDLIVAVLCGEYVAREWCGLEWRAIYSHIMDGNSKRVMLFRADDAEIRGLHGGKSEQYAMALYSGLPETRAATSRYGWYHRGRDF